jgi:hypothetical protein
MTGKRILAIAAALLAQAFLTPAAAQYIGQVGQQTVVNSQATPNTPVLNAVTVPTVSAALTNIGSTNPCMVYTSSGAANLQTWIEGSFDGSTYVVISDTATNPSQGGVCAYVFTPLVRLRLAVLTPVISFATFTANYVGSSVPPSQSLGIFGLNGWDFLTVAYQANAATTTTYMIKTPRGRSGGTLTFFFNSVPGCSGAIVALEAIIDGGVYTQPLLTGGSVAAGFTTQFDIKDTSSPMLDIFYTHGTSCTGQTYTILYSYNQPLNGQIVQSGSVKVAGGIGVQSIIAKAAGGLFYGINVSYNANAATMYVQCFDSPTVPADGTVPTIALGGISFPVSAGATSYYIPPGGPVVFNTGLTCVISSTQATKTLDATADLSAGISYQ